MRRREFITLLFGGGAAAWPVTILAQQGQQKRRIGVLVNGEETDPEQRARLAAFQKALQGLGWTSAANLQIDIRYGIDGDDLRKRAQELVALSPDLIFASTPPSVIAVKKVSRTVPIVF